MAKVVKKAEKKVEKKVAVEVTEESAISKKDIIEMIAEESDYMKSAIQEIGNSFFDKIKELLSEGKTVSIHSFGTFSVRDTEPRKGRNPKTGESIDIPAGKRVSFKFSSAVKNAVKNQE